VGSEKKPLPDAATTDVLLSVAPILIF